MTNEQLKELLPGCPDETAFCALGRGATESLAGWLTKENGRAA